jgi:hypothetical protein
VSDELEFHFEVTGAEIRAALERHDYEWLVTHVFNPALVQFLEKKNTDAHKEPVGDHCQGYAGISRCTLGGTVTRNRRTYIGICGQRWGDMHRDARFDFVALFGLDSFLTGTGFAVTVGLACSRATVTLSALLAGSTIPFRAQGGSGILGTFTGVWLRFRRSAGLQLDDVIGVCGSHSSPPGREPVDGVRRWLIRGVHVSVYAVSPMKEKPGTHWMPGLMSSRVEATVFEGRLQLLDRRPHLLGFNTPVVPATEALAVIEPCALDELRQGVPLLGRELEDDLPHRLPSTRSM